MKRWLPISGSLLALYVAAGAYVVAAWFHASPAANPGAVLAWPGVAAEWLCWLCGHLSTGAP